MSANLITTTPVEPPPGLPASGAARLSLDDQAALKLARDALERSTLTGRLSGLAGKPLELVGSMLPAAARDIAAQAVEKALAAALKVALTSLPKAGSPQAASGRLGGRLNTALAAASGALGGALGLATLPLELPVSTTLILRQIAEVAREEGEDLDDPETALACMQVFALGSHTPADDLASSGYFAVRGLLAKSLAEAARLAAGRGLADGSAPVLMRFIAQIAARFGIVVSQKVAAGAVPVLGALGGAAVNVAFAEHFRTVARAHFTVRRLERVYGAPAVRAAYDEIKSAFA